MHIVGYNYYFSLDLMDNIGLCLFIIKSKYHCNRVTESNNFKDNERLYQENECENSCSLHLYIH